MRRNLDDDRLFLHEIKKHSLEKYKRHDLYTRIFATGMKNRWPQRAYIGLYAGPGRARLESTGEIVETAALGALRVPDPFTHYVFVDNDKRCLDALEMRAAVARPGVDVKLIHGDVNDSVPAIRNALPAFSPRRGLLSFCFVDPFAANLRFDTLRALAAYRMDFLLVLMLGGDVRRNFKRYYADESDTRIAELIDCPDWRSEFRSRGKGVVGFVLDKFDEAMRGLGYVSPPDDLIHWVNVAGKATFLYVMVLYSRNQLGSDFWRETLDRSDLQLRFELQ